MYINTEFIQNIGVNCDLNRNGGGPYRNGSEMGPGASLGCGGEGGGEDMNLPLYPPPLETTLGKVNIVIFSGKNSFFQLCAVLKRCLYNFK